jgi:Flp pilus assembly protein TadD
MGLLWFLFFAVPPTIYRLENADTFFNYLEHRTYLPMMGIVIIIGLFINERIDNPKFSKPFIIGYIPVIIIFSIIAWFHCNDYKDSFSVSNRAANLNNPSALAGRANKYIEKGDTISALADIQKAIALNPNDPVMFMQHGKVMAKMQNHVQAERDFAMALTLMPNLVEGLMAHAVECRFLGKTNPKKYEVAFRDIFKAQSLDPNNPKIYNSFGNLFVEVKNYKEADSSYTKALRLNKAYAEAYNNRAYTRLFLFNYKGSLNDCDSALKLMKTKAPAVVYNNKAHAFRELNQLDSAFKYFNKAIKMKPDFKEAYYERGIAFYKLNNTEKACNDWNKALQLGYADAKDLLDKYCVKIKN